MVLEAFLQLVSSCVDASMIRDECVMDSSLSVPMPTKFPNICITCGNPELQSFVSELAAGFVAVESPWSSCDFSSAAAAAVWWWCRFGER